MRKFFLLSSVALATVFAAGCATAWHDVFPVVIVSPPSNQSVFAGQSAQFVVVAQSQEQLQYQWYQSGVAIPGATTPTLQIASTFLSQSGTLFSVKVWTDTDSSTPSPAQLTVSALDPHLSLAAIGDRSYSASSIQLNAISASSAPIVYSVTSGSALASGSQITLTGIGHVTVTATQIAQGNYGPGTSSQSFNVTPNVVVSPISPAVTTMGPGAIPFAAQATGGKTNQLLWLSSAGTWSAASTWTSPNIVGTYGITAQSVDDPTKSSTASVTISAPVIFQQPASPDACPAGDVVLNVGANFATNYQWLANGSLIAGATSSGYTVGALAPSVGAGVYTVNVSNAAGSVMSQAVSTPSISEITQQPMDATIATTEHATFVVQAAGRSPFTYQWYGVQQPGTSPLAIPDATNTSYTTPALSTAQSGGQVYAVVTDACGRKLTSNTATVTVTPTYGPPEIDQQPLSVSIIPGGSVSFTVHATGTPALTYQWYVVPAGTSGPGSAVAGATLPTLSLPASATALANDQDSYYVTVTNAYGRATSLSATLAVGAGISIQQQPQSISIQSGRSAAFSVVASSQLPLTYQWYMAAIGSSSFQPIAGATSSVYTIASALPSDDGSAYYVVVSNGVTASVQSSTAMLFVNRSSSDIGCPWVAVGTAVVLDSCSFQLTDAVIDEAGSVVIPKVFSTNGVTISFTATLDEASDPPADGFAVVFGDPTLGATPSSLGIHGAFLGAGGIPGLAVIFDTYYNSSQTNWPGDAPVPYVAVTRSETALFEAPYSMANSAIPALVVLGQSTSHDFVIQSANGGITVTMDGTEILTGSAAVPPSAYLYLTASTGGKYERTILSNLKVSAQTGP